MPGQMLMLLSIIFLVSSSFVQLMNGHGHCLTTSSPDNYIVLPATALCNYTLAEQHFQWDAESRLCNRKGECLFIRSPWYEVYPMCFWPPLAVEGQLWHLTPWGHIVDAKGQCLNSNQTTGSAVHVAACNITSLGQQWVKYDV